ncbi:peptidoglycan-recognition protein LC-like [Athalia rosae]|uniref:peptidoglycan-recognition protein LC-like n=1 Tax=Athalia rosae TaxID=37344 RepID=UPI00203417F1|nr:peptidoglycan-recognition protein LC-like [Athalia rosae]
MLIVAREQENRHLERRRIGEDNLGYLPRDADDDDDDVEEEEDDEAEEEEDDEAEDSGDFGDPEGIPGDSSLLEEGEDSGAWSRDAQASVSSLQQRFDNGVVLPVGESPSFGDVCVKNSANVHFGNKTFYNGPVTIKQIVYANPAVRGDAETDDGKADGTRCFAENSCPTAAEGEKFAGEEAPRAAKKDGEERKAWEWCSCLLTWRCVALMCAMGSCLVAAMVVSVVLLTRDTEPPPTPIFPEIPDSSLDDNGIPLGKLRFVERAEWGAQPPTEPLERLRLPVPYVFISHTATDFCKTQSECVFRVRFAQTFHIESRNWSDIGYNFLVGGDGYAYVGRSWDFVGAHTYDYNARSIGVSFIGTFNTVVPPKHQLHAVRQLIELGVKGGKISPDYKLLGHRQVSKTLSPGDALYNVIKTWPHWSPTP